nr:hypothetical protein [Tanacetum cinerariifolium]
MPSWFVVLSVSSPNEPKSRVFPSNPFQMLNTRKETINTRVENPSTQKSVRIITGPAGIVQAAKLLKQRDILLGWDMGVMSTQEYMKKVVEDVGEDDDFKSGRRLEKDIAVGAALILANVLVFSPKPLMHYLNITMRNVVKVFRKDMAPESGSGNALP